MIGFSSIDNSPQNPFRFSFTLSSFVGPHRGTKMEDINANFVFPIRDVENERVKLTPFIVSTRQDWY